MSNTQSQELPDLDSNSGSPMPGEPEFLAVGKLHRPHGLRGEILMSVWTDFPERLQSDKQVYAGTEFLPLIIKKFRKHGKGSLISFFGYSNREEIGRLRNHIVYVRSDEIPPLPNEEIYLHQLIGLRVIQDSDDYYLGNIVETIETGANHVLLIRRMGKPDLLLPDIDQVVLSIDLKKGVVRVNLLPGLLPDEDL
jgi:16S rRNA processing protein RimM